MTILTETQAKSNTFSSVKRLFDEIVAKLEEYLKQLQSEVRGVEEHLTELKKES